MKLRKLFSLTPWALAVVFIGTSCVKEGPPGPQGQPGENGADANETCKQCHNPAIVDQKIAEYNFSKHKYGEAEFEEGGRNECAACHSEMGFHDVINNNKPATFVLNTTTNKYVNSYAASSSASIGEFSCFTCHSNLHTSYTYADFSPFSTTAAVSMTMWGGAKSINLTQDGAKSNLCIKCHQPRAITKGSDGNVIDYNALKVPANFNNLFVDPNSNNGVLKPNFRTGVHYGTVGAIFAGTGGVEFAGTMGYANAQHTTKASCSDCHQAALNGRSGGHTFFAKGNFNGCNTTECHGANTVSASNAKYWVNPRTQIKSLLDQLASKLQVNGVEILNRNPDSEDNLWYSQTTNHYDGYLNIYDASSNPGGQFQNPSPSGSWSQAQKDANSALPKLAITNVQMGAIINFQLCLREYSLGIHNLDYTKALLTNSIAVLP